MDLDTVLKLEYNHFPIETDSDLNSHLIPYFKIQEQQPVSQAIPPQPSIPDLLQELQESQNIIDIPLLELLTEIRKKYDGFSHEFHEIERALRKRKIQLKRERARNRNYRQKKEKEMKKEINLIECKIPISDDELKRKKNRISAQISRDKKKQFFNNLVSQNESLKKANSSLERQNMRLKNILNGQINYNLTKIIDKFQASTIMMLLEEAQKQKRSKRKTKNSKIKAALTSILDSIEPL